MALNILANGHIGLQSDQVTFIHLAAFDASKNMVPIPAGDVDTVASTGPHAASIAFTVGVMPAGATDAGAPAVVCTPTVLESDAANAGGGIGLTITDSAGLAQAPTLFFDVVPDVAAVAIGLDTSVTAVAAQPAPVAPGP